MKFYIPYVAFIATFLWAVNQFLEKPLWKTTEPTTKKRINFKFEKSFATLTERDTNTVGYHYQVIHHHFSKPAHYASTTANIYRDDVAIERYYADLVDHKDTLTVALARLGNALIEYYKKDSRMMVLNLENAEFSGIYQRNEQLAKQKYYNLALGKIYSQKVLSIIPSIEAFEKEIELKGDTASAYIELIKIWHKKRDFDELHKLVQNPHLLPYFQEVSPRVLPEVYFVKGYFVKYLQLTFRLNTNYIGVIASLFIALTWFLYLIRLKVFQKPNYLALFSCFLVASLFTFFAFPLYDFFDLILGFRLKGYLFNDFPYMILGIGLIEETIKFLPWLLMLTLFPKVFKEPVDYLLFASVAALGFAATENFIYLARDSAAIIQRRAFMPTLGHLFDSSIIAYGMIMVRYREKRPMWFQVLLYFLLAATVHGIYDFWLYVGISLFSVAIAIVGMAIWITFLNNALNISPYFDYQKVFSSSKLRRFVIIALTGIVLFDYGSTALLKGASLANQELLGTLIFAGFFMAFMSTSLANFDLVKGYWSPPYKTSFFSKVNYNRFVGTWIHLQPKWSTQNMPTEEITLPDKLQIKGRYVFGDQTNYFEIALEQPIEIEGKVINYLFIQLKYKNSFFDSKEKNHTTIFYINNYHWPNPSQTVYRKEMLKPWVRASVQKVEV
ncbi:MAG TPA: hypothetical protein DCS93_36105 [Microscillaceae bacterium]|nr:hypothetical protein [Microscillaceae bacterium]